ncbi:MAG: DinB family protein [Chloroflexi bacterium]|nr:DinB family protein [Chloroflexota bacterium]
MAEMNEDQLRVRSYLQAQAAKLSVAELVAKARTDAMPLRAAAAAIPAGRFAERPAGGEWSAAEVTAHILQMSEQGASSIEAIIAGAPAPTSIRDLMEAGPAGAPVDAGDFWDRFTPRREQFYQRVLPASGNEHLDVLITHPMFGALNWREWLLFMRVHDLDHLRQLQALPQQLA